MAGPSADRITEWEGGSLNELVAMLQAAALPVRIEVIAPGTTGSNAGEVHLLAGGLADAFAGSLRRDDAMAALQRLEGARYVIESRLPNPESGSLSEPGPHQGNLKDRSLASLMRYCEEYVLTCRLEVWRSQDRAVISYRRGEIISTVVGGGEGSELLPEVMGWTEGFYEIILPAPVLPQMPSRGRDGARAERKRHTTLPMVTAQEGRPEGQSASRSDAGAKVPVAGPAATGTAGAPRPGATPLVQPTALASAPQVGPAAIQPAQPVATQPAAARQSAPSSAAPGPRSAGLAAQKAAPQQSVPTATAPKPVAAPPRPITMTTPRPAAVAIAGPLQPEMTARGTPPVPSVPLVPAPGPQPATRPTMQGAGVPLVPPKSATPAQPKPAGTSAQPAPQVHPKPNPFAIQPAPQPKPNAFAAQPVAQPRPVAPSAQPAPQPQPKPVAPSAQPAPQPQPKPAAPSAQPAPQPQPKPAPPAQAASASPAAPLAAQPPAQPANPAEKPQSVSALPPKPSPAASNDLMPASGTFEAKPKHANYLPPTTPPIQILDEPQAIATEQPSTPVVVPSRTSTPGRRRAAARKRIGEHPVRVYIFVGLAIGVGIVLAYWAYWYLPFGHH